MSSPARSRRRLQGKGPRAIGIVLFFLACFASTISANQPDKASATISGSAFVRDSDGNPSMVTGAKVRLTGPATLEVETDQNGEYVIRAVSYGVYTVEVSSTGLKTVQTVRVEAKETHLDVELKPAEVTSSVTVTADPAETKGPAPSETISDKTLRDAPTVNERFESSLPLVPGVVRGPDGHVNLKGTRSTQSRCE